LFICKYEQSSARQSLISLPNRLVIYSLLRLVYRVKKPKILPPLTKEHEALFCNRSFEFYQHYQQPKEGHQWTRNSCANKNVKIFVHQHPKHLAYNFEKEVSFLQYTKIYFSVSYFLCSKVLILKPKVGDIVSMSSPLKRLRIVVLPALSNPLFSICLNV